MVSRLVSGLKDRQLDSCTNIMIVSDHGKLKSPALSSRIQTLFDFIVLCYRIFVTKVGHLQR